MLWAVYLRDGRRAVRLRTERNEACDDIEERDDEGRDTLPLSLQLARHFVVAGKRFVDRVGKYSAVVRAIDLSAVVT